MYFDMTQGSERIIDTNLSNKKTNIKKRLRFKQILREMLTKKEKCKTIPDMNGKRH